MSRAVSPQKVDQAIQSATREREIRRRIYEDRPGRQRSKVLEMNQVLDILRWAKKMLEAGVGEKPRHFGRRDRTDRGNRGW